MSELVVNNPNMIIDASSIRTGYRRVDRASGCRDETNTAARLRLREIRQEIDATVCSATWAEDCLYRGADYSPDFKCACPVCRNLFPDRLYPRPVRESDYSLDCQVEAGEDPEFAEELARLRNDRARAGSVFIGRASGQRARGKTGGRRSRLGGDS